jgi:hypothetical protein
MPERSYYMRQAQVCRSLANNCDDATLRERYERLALDYFERAMESVQCDEENFLVFLTSRRLAPNESDTVVE